MPIYRYKCDQCGSEDRALVLAKNADGPRDCACGGMMGRQISSPQSRAVETADEYRGVKSAQNVEQMVEDRARQHFREHELPRLIAEHGVEHAKAQGFLDEDGKPR